MEDQNLIQVDAEVEDRGIRRRICRITPLGESVFWADQRRLAMRLRSAFAG
jgi:hypothetical protein